MEAHTEHKEDSCNEFNHVHAKKVIRFGKFKSKKRMLAHYELKHTIGTGLQGKVKLGINTKNGEAVAVKIIEKEQLYSRWRRKVASERLQRKVHNRTDPRTLTPDHPAFNRLRREIEIMRDLNGHPNVIHLIEVIWDAHLPPKNPLRNPKREQASKPNHQGNQESTTVQRDRIEKHNQGKPVVAIIMELAKGGELFDYMFHTGAFPETLVRPLLGQLLCAVHSFHSHGICHRDIKPENLLLDASYRLKIIDFGLSAYTIIRPGESRSELSLDRQQNGDLLLYTRAGTKCYMAPEVLSQETSTRNIFSSADSTSPYGSGYDGKAADIWSLGVVLFLMIAGFPPFQVADRTDWWFNELCEGRYHRFWKAHLRSSTFSKSSMDLLTRMFCPNPKRRPTLQQVMNHPYCLDLFSETPRKIHCKPVNFVNFNSSMLADLPQAPAVYCFDLLQHPRYLAAEMVKRQTIVLREKNTQLQKKKRNKEDTPKPIHIKPESQPSIVDSPRMRKKHVTLSSKASSEDGYSSEHFHSATDDYSQADETGVENTRIVNNNTTTKDNYGESAETVPTSCSMSDSQVSVPGNNESQYTKASDGQNMNTIEEQSKDCGIENRVEVEKEKSEEEQHLVQLLEGGNVGNLQHTTYRTAFATVAQGNVGILPDSSILDGLKSKNNSKGEMELNSKQPYNDNVHKLELRNATEEETKEGGAWFMMDEAKPNAKQDDKQSTNQSSLIEKQRENALVAQKQKDKVNVEEMNKRLNGLNVELIETSTVTHVHTEQIELQTEELEQNFKKETNLLEDLSMISTATSFVSKKPSNFNYDPLLQALLHVGAKLECVTNMLTGEYKFEMQMIWKNGEVLEFAVYIVPFEMFNSKIHFQRLAGSILSFHEFVHQVIDSQILRECIDGF